MEPDENTLVRIALYTEVNCFCRKAGMAGLAKNGSDWPQMGQIQDFSDQISVLLIWDLSYFGPIVSPVGPIVTYNWMSPVIAEYVKPVP